MDRAGDRDPRTGVHPDSDPLSEQLINTVGAHTRINSEADELSPKPRAYLYERVVKSAMTDENEPVQHCTVDEPVNLPTALEAAAIEYLDVDDQRTIAIYQHAILMVIASKGQATEAWEFTVELWEEPPDGLPRDPDDLITAFLNELLATTNAVRTGDHD